MIGKSRMFLASIDGKMDSHCTSFISSNGWIFLALFLNLDL